MVDAPLTWNGRVWHGHTETYRMSMGQETFQRYLTTHQEGLRGHPTPTPHEAMQTVTRLSYWAYARYDRAIRFVRLPGCVLGEEGKAHE